MDGLVDKFSVFDFFNLIIGGFLFLVGLGVGFYFNLEKSFINELADVFMEYTLIVAIVMLALSFVLRLLMSEIECLIFYKWLKWETKLMSECLKDFRVVENIKKYEIYRKKALQYFKQEECQKKSDEFTEDECVAFYAHCVYYIQIRSQNQKTERLREVTGLAGILVMVFGMLIISEIITNFIVGTVSTISVTLLLIYAICLALLLHRYKRAMKNRIKMVLAVYDVCVEKEACEGNTVY